MSKVTMTFNLPEENSEYKIAFKASDMAQIIHEFTEKCRANVKYGDKPDTTWEEVKDMWWEILKDYSYSPYED